MTRFNKELEQKPGVERQREIKKISSAGEKIIYSPLAGEVIQMSDVPDDTFAAEILGKGIAVIPTEGKLVAPCDGEISTLFETKHAIGITSQDGVELLVHIGINTVELQGKYYESYVKQGDKVKAGQLLLVFDVKKIKEAGYNITTPVIITNTEDYKDIMGIKTGNTETMDPLIRLESK